MLGAGQLLNRRPNFNQYNQMHGGRDMDDDDEPVMSSFTKSKVDDDDEKFNKNNMTDDNFLDMLIKKKKGGPAQPQTKESPNLNDSFKTDISLPVTPPQSEKNLKSKTDARPPGPKTVPTQLTTPQAPPKSKANEIKKQQDTPVIAQREKEPLMDTPVPAVQPIQPIETPKKVIKPTEQPKTSEKKQATSDRKSVEPPVVQPKPIMDTLKTPEKDLRKSDNRKVSELSKGSPKELPIQPPPPVVTPQKSSSRKPTGSPMKIPETILEEPVDHDIKQGVDFRPQFVRRGKNTTEVIEIVRQMKEDISDDRVRAIEPINYIEVSRELSLRNQPDSQFEDTIFPPNSRQVFQIYRESQNNNIDFRIADMGRPMDTVQVVDPNDIQPGQYSSNLNGALSAAAEHPLIFHRIFENQELSTIGYYYVRLFIGGVWKYITLDDKMANNIVSTSAMDARLKQLNKSNVGFQSELWPYFIEKALAKVYGSYEDMNIGGSVVDSLSELTGSPAYSELITDQLLNNLQGTIVGVITGHYGYPQGLTYLGYDATKQQVNVRNPWGWCQNVPKYVGAEGEFSLPLRELAKSELHYANYHQSYYSISHGVKQLPDCYSTFEVSVPEDNHCYFTLYQKDIRYFRNNLAQKYQYSNARILLFDENSNLIASNSEVGKSLTIEANIAKGKYYVIVCLDWRVQYDCTLTYYGEQNVTINKKGYRDDPNILGQLLANHAIKEGVKKGTLNKVDEYQWSGLGLLVIAWINRSKEQIKWKKDLRKMVNRMKQTPLTFIKGFSGISKMTTQQLINRRDDDWQLENEVELQLSPNVGYAVVLRE